MEKKNPKDDDAVTRCRFTRQQSRGVRYGCLSNEFVTRHEDLNVKFERGRIPADFHRTEGRGDRCKPRKVFEVRAEVLKRYCYMVWPRYIFALTFSIHFANERLWHDPGIIVYLTMNTVYTVRRT